MEENPTCYLCKTPSPKLAFKKLGHEIYQCVNSHCRLYFLKFEDSYNTFIKEYYSKGFFKGDKRLRAYADYEGDKLVEQKNMTRYLRRIIQFKKHGKILDVGCAMGFLLELASQKGFDTYGIDVSDYAVKIAQKKFGNKIQLSPLSHATLKEKFFDVITMFDLIEHLKTPREDLQKLRNSLKDDGILIIQTGDVESLWAKRMKKNWHFFAPPQHLFFFSQNTLTKLLGEAGFKVVKIEKHGKWVSLRYLFHMMRYVDRDSLGDFLYTLVHKNFLGKIPVFLRFNDNMILYAKKS